MTGLLRVLGRPEYKTEPRDKPAATLEITRSATRCGFRCGKAAAGLPHHKRLVGEIEVYGAGWGFASGRVHGHEN